MKGNIRQTFCKTLVRSPLFALCFLAWLPFVSVAQMNHQLLPKDPFFKQQWGIYNDGTQKITLDQDDLHSIQQQGVNGIDIGWLDAQENLNQLKKSAVTVAVIDSGIDVTHPDLQGVISPEGWNFLDNNDQIFDDLGHGTHISGQIAANSGNGIVGTLLS